MQKTEIRAHLQSIADNYTTIHTESKAKASKNNSNNFYRTQDD